MWVTLAYRTMSYSEPWHTQNSLFKHFQGHWWIFIHTHRCATSREERGLLCPFLRTEKGVLILQKSPNYVHLWVKFSIQNVVLKVSRRKNSFPVFLTRCISKCPSSTKPSLLWKISGCTPALRHYSFCKTFHLKCLRVFFLNTSLSW